MGSTNRQRMGGNHRKYNCVCNSDVDARHRLRTSLLKDSETPTLANVGVRMLLEEQHIMEHSEGDTLLHHTIEACLN